MLALIGEYQPSSRSSMVDYKLIAQQEKMFALIAEPAFEALVRQTHFRRPF
jgi:hypothetical protein